MGRLKYKPRQKSNVQELIQTMRAVLRDIARGKVSSMGGFANLKTTFDNLLPHLAAEAKKAKPDPPALAAYLQLRALFEIAGNLDSISLAQRAQVEQFEKMRISVQEFTASALEIVTNKMEEFKVTGIDMIRSEIAKQFADLGFKDDDKD